MNLIDAQTHEEWKKYILRGGVLNQSSFVRFYEKYPEILRDIEHNPSTAEADESASDVGLKGRTAQYCAAFATLGEIELDLRDIHESPIYWHSSGWHVREALLLINDSEAQKLRETSY